MRRRLLLGNLVFVVVLLLVLEVPLAVVYSHHEHDAVTVALQRDASTVAGVIQEILEHPSGHDLGAFAASFEARSGDRLLVIDAVGTLRQQAVVPAAAALTTPGLDAAHRGQTVTGESADLLYVAVPVSSRDETLGAVVVARADRSVDARVHGFWLFLAGLAVVVVGVVALVTDRLARWISRPLRELGDRARDIGEGDLGLRVETSGPSEVLELAERFNEMADRLDTLLTAQRRFVADASHQLRTPLTALRLRLENLELDAPASASIDAALAEVARLSRLVDGLLLLARAERHDQPRERVDVVAIVGDRRDTWVPLAAEQGVELRLGAFPEGAEAVAVPGALEQILDNLIANALEATPSGGTVECRVAAVGDRVEVHVIDDGYGMTDAERRNAFDPFWQGRRSTGGSGLGLAIVEQLARASGGTIALHSSPSEGVDAVVRLVAAGDRIEGTPASVLGVDRTLQRTDV